MAAAEGVAEEESVVAAVLSSSSSSSGSSSNSSSGSRNSWQNNNLRDLLESCLTGPLWQPSEAAEAKAPAKAFYLGGSRCLCNVFWTGLRV